MTDLKKEIQEAEDRLLVRLSDGQIIGLANAAFYDQPRRSEGRKDNDLFYIRTVRAAIGLMSQEENKVAQYVPVAAEHRFYSTDRDRWSKWQPSRVNLERPARSVDSHGCPVEYRILYERREDNNPKSAQESDSGANVCRHCKGANLSWFTTNHIKTDVQQGRLNTSDVECQFVLGCNDCSETLLFVNADEVARYLNENPGVSLRRFVLRPN